MRGCRPESAARCTGGARELLEARHAGRIERVLPQLVHHFFQGDVPDKTVEYALRLARHVARRVQRGRGEAVRGERADISGRRMGGRSADRRRRTAAAGARPAHGRGRRQRLRETAAAMRIFETSVTPRGSLPGCCLAAETAWQLRLPEETRRWVEQALPLAREAGATQPP